MIISANTKRTPPPQQGTFNLRLKSAGLSLAVFAASLLLIACPSPGGGETTTPNPPNHPENLHHHGKRHRNSLAPRRIIEHQPARRESFSPHHTPQPGE